MDDITLDQRGTIYGLFDPRNALILKNCRYIGQTASTTAKRLSQHIGAARNEDYKWHVMQWIRSLLAADVRPVMVALERPLVSMLDDRETIWIAYARDCGWRLTNTKDGGNGMTDADRQRLSEALSGRSPSPEHRAKISATLTGRKRGPMPQEWRDKISEAHTGKVRTPEHQAKLNESRRGWSPSEETRAKMSEARIGVEPWNKGVKGSVPWNKGKKGVQVAWNKGLRKNPDGTWSKKDDD